MKLLVMPIIFVIIPWEYGTLYHQAQSIKETDKKQEQLTSVSCVNI